jgi:hypothetical protein
VDDARKARLAKLKAMEPTLLDRRQRCAGELAVISTWLRRKKNEWENTCIDFTSLYESAWNEFTSKFDQREKDSAAFWTLAFIALSTVSSGGIAVFVKVAGDKWIQSASKELIISGTTDTVQAGVGGLLSLVPGKLAEEYPRADFPSPLKVMGELKKILNRMENDMLFWIEEKQKEINNVPLAKFEFYDPFQLKTEIEAFIQSKDEQCSKISKQLDNASFKNHVKNELVKAMWVQWVARSVDPSKGAAVRIHWSGIYSRMPNFVIDKLVEYHLIDTGGRFSDYDVLKLARDPDGPAPRKVMMKAVHRARSLKPKTIDDLYVNAVKALPAAR